ncbi:bifunctional 3-dehydroquinate dehydratase/shikimate dehydrogenase chloroplastic [Phtheirospermum japonicum]|uniref:Bifunctional 3-dehydroquinate dehydratase/shikimate dehydrogenase chloroplastic n=1 Tax=Phtheirospermum japonicum TaxID=374723 RepID=A0A830CGH0_9LAMI|nr:bifunctional 3-dehydroquinate dehydratase/shikimate dehydrogenase chloroplastic [Phtheirospermum japonicum]
METGVGIRKNETLICAPLMADTVDQVVELMHKAKSKGADIVEIRLDHLKSFNPHADIEKLIKQCPLPTLFTYRPIWEGGQYDGDENSRFNALKLAMELGADHIDIELKAADEFNNFMGGSKPEKCKVIVSSHNYESTPSAEDLGNLVARIQGAGADIVKFATTATDITDVARVFQITVHCQIPIIAMVMGERGLISRILCPKFGGYLTFGTLEPGKVSAPGQPTIDELINLFNFRLIDSDTKVFGIIGKPVSHSKSPKLYNTAFRADGVNGVFVHLLVDDVRKFFETYSSPDFSGFSCTIPHKEVALTCCDEVDPVAKSIGAVNCVIRRPNDGKLFGCNTDYIGAISAIESGLQGSRASGIGSPLAGKLFIVIGAGGAGKALAYGAKEKGARIVIANRTYDRARELADFVGGQALSLAELDSFYPENGMILANTTSIGMQPKVEDTPVSKEALRHYELVFDAVYTPKITRLLREADEVGAKIVTGVEMFIGQAYEQYERFTGLPAPKQLFKEIMKDY